MRYIFSKVYRENTCALRQAKMEGQRWAFSLWRILCASHHGICVAIDHSFEGISHIHPHQATDTQTIWGRAPVYSRRSLHPRTRGEIKDWHDWTKPLSSPSISIDGVLSPYSRLGVTIEHRFQCPRWACASFPVCGARPKSGGEWLDTQTTWRMGQWVEAADANDECLCRSDQRYGLTTFPLVNFVDAPKIRTVVLSSTSFTATQKTVTRLCANLQINFLKRWKFGMMAIGLPEKKILILYTILFQYYCF